MISGAEHETARAGVVTVDAIPANGQTESAPDAARLIHSEIAGPAQKQKPEVRSQNTELNQEADMIRFIDAFWAHLNDMRRPAPTAELYRLNPGTATCLMDQCRIEHARLVVLDAQRGAEWLGKSRKKARV